METRGTLGGQNMVRVGYGRVSTLDQHALVQRELLTAAGCERIFLDEGVSGAKASRPQLDRCLDYLRPGDVLVVTKLDRLGRSVRNLITLADSLREQGVDLVATQQQIDTTTSTGKLLFTMLAAIAEFERDLTRERTRDGLAAARARGHVGGRPTTISQDVIDLALARKGRGESTTHIAKSLGVGRSTLYRALSGL
jgi:DNA invertase Pin-like site-specific DNA recombinase